jgi:hypothetical protein
MLDLVRNKTKHSSNGSMLRFSTRILWSNSSFCSLFVVLATSLFVLLLLTTLWQSCGRLVLSIMVVTKDPSVVRGKRVALVTG